MLHPQSLSTAFIYIRKLASATSQAHDFVLTETDKLEELEARAGDTHENSDVDEAELDVVFGDADAALGEEELDPEDASILAEFEKGDGDDAEIDLEQLELEEKKAKDSIKQPQQQPQQQNRHHKPHQQHEATTAASPAAPKLDESANSKGAQTAPNPRGIGATSKPASPETPAVAPTKAPSPRAGATASSPSANAPKASHPASPPVGSPTSQRVLASATTEEANAEILAARNAGYDKMIGLLRSNIEDLTGQIKFLLVKKTDEANAQASKFLGIRRHRERQLELVLKGKALGLPIPPFQLVKLTLEKEKTLSHISEDEMKVGLQWMTYFFSLVSNGCPREGKFFTCLS